MIARIYGDIEGFSSRGVYLRVGGIVYEVLLMAAEKREIEIRPLGEELSLHTLYFMEGGIGGSSYTPALVGFQNPRHREFFELFIRVEGIGITKALKILSVPVPQVAKAIEENNLAFLCTLKQVGERTARKLVASLMGKVGAYAREEGESRDQSTDTARAQTAASLGQSKRDGDNGDKGSSRVSAEQRLEQLRDQAAEVLEQLGYSNNEVKKLLNRAFEKRPTFNKVEEILEEIYRGKSQPEAVTVSNK